METKRELLEGIESISMNGKVIYQSSKEIQVENMLKNNFTEEELKAIDPAEVVEQYKALINRGVAINE